MDIKTIAGILALITATITVSAAGTRGVVYLADTRYITQEAWVNKMDEIKMTDLKKQIRHLEIKVQYNEATPSEKALLEELKRDYEEARK